MYPHERSLVKKLENKPFTLLGINSDPKENILKAMKREKIVWPFFWDGGDTGGPIAKAWGVHSWPTTYVIDGDGVIRYKNLRGERLEKVVDELLAKMKSPPTTQPGN